MTDRRRPGAPRSALPGLVVAAGTAGVTGLCLAWAVPGPTRLSATPAVERYIVWRSW